MATRDDLVAALSMGTGAMPPAAVDPRWQRLMQQLMPPPVRGINPLQPTNQMAAQYPPRTLDELAAIPPLVDSQGEMTAYDPTQRTLRERLGDWAYQGMQGLGLPVQAERVKSDVALGTNAPGIDEVLTAHEAGQALGGGEWGKAALLGAGILVPGPGNARQAARAAARAERTIVPSLEQMMEGPNQIRPPLEGLHRGAHPQTISPARTYGQDRETISENVFHPASMEPMRRAGPIIERTRKDRGILGPNTTIFQHNMSLMQDPRTYPGMAGIRGSQDPEEILAHAMEVATGNKHYMMDRATPAQKQGKLWYPSAKDRIILPQARLYGVHDASATGAYAGLSPQKDWRENVYLGDQVLDIFHNQQNHQWDDGMSAWADTKIAQEAADEATRRRTFEKQIAKRFKDGSLSAEEANAALATYEPKVELTPLLEAMKRDRPMLRESIAEHPEDGAMWIRSFEEAHGDQSPRFGDQPGGHGYREISPDGTFGDYVLASNGEREKAKWSSNLITSSAIKSLLAEGDRYKIAAAMGQANKVPSFDVNLLDPNNPFVSTNDTHDVGAAWMMPYSGNDAAVAHGLGNGRGKGSTAARFTMLNSDRHGSNGTYGFYSDVNKRTGAERPQTMLPREVQSETWTIKKDMFDEATLDEKARVRAAWDAYAQNPTRDNLEATRATVWDIGQAGQARKLEKLRRAGGR